MISQFITQLTAQEKTEEGQCTALALIFFFPIFFLSFFF